MSAFSRLWSSEIQGIEFGGSAPDVFVSSNIQISARDYYDRMVTFLWFRAREVIEARQFRGMSEEVMQEGCFREWGFIGKNRVSVEPKEQMKLKSGRSPDLFDALVCGIWGAQQRGFVIKMDKSKFQSPNTNDQWKLDLRKKSQALKQHGQMDYARS